MQPNASPGKPIARKRRTRRFPRVFVCFSAGLTLALFYGVLFGDRQFNFRDEAHFYHPVFRYVQEELGAGRFPLWTPYDNLGQPLFANAALGILYPGKLIFFLPLDYSVLFNWYIVGHFFLAAVTFYRLARSWNRSTWGSTFGALAYTYGGAVFGLYSNPIFLVGAAWAPEALLHADRMLTRRNVREALLLAVVLSLMLLGGDPQASYHFGLVAALLALFRRCRERKLLKMSGPVLESVSKNKRRRPFGLFQNRFTLLALAACVAFSLTAVQVLPSVEFARFCDRSGGGKLRSLWDIPGFLFAGNDGFDEDNNDRKTTDSPHSGNRIGRIAGALLFQNGIEDFHQRMSYDFSTHPVQFATFLWFPFGGISYPQNLWWISQVADLSKRFGWFFTFYIGIVPFLLAVGSFRFRPIRDRNIRVVWLSWLSVFAVLTTTGYYGFGWLLRTCFGLEILSDPVGGVYWLFQMFVPGYVFFRYSTKMMTVAALLLSMLAVYGWDRLARRFVRSDALPIQSDGFGRYVLNASLGVMFLSLILLLAAWGESGWNVLTSKIAADSHLGPFQADLARLQAIQGYFQTACILFLFLLVVRFRDRFAKPILFCILLSATAVDLYLACEPTLLLTDRDLYRKRTSSLVEAIEKDRPDEVAPHRIFLHISYPDSADGLDSWQRTSDPDRWTEAMRWSRDNLLYLFCYDLQRDSHGNLPVCRTFQEGSMVPFRFFRRLEHAVRDEMNLEQNLADFGVEYVLMASNKPLDSRFATPIFQEAVPEVSPGGRGGNILWRLHDPRPRIRIERNHVSGKTADIETGRILEYKPGKIVAETTLSENGTVVLSEQYWPGWKVDVESISDWSKTITQKPTVHPFDGLYQGVDLPAGTFRLTFRYSPKTFLNGAILSATAWILLVPFLVIPICRRPRCPAERP